MLFSSEFTSKNAQVCLQVFWGRVSNENSARDFVKYKHSDLHLINLLIVNSRVSQAMMTELQ